LKKEYINEHILIEGIKAGKEFAFEYVFKQYYKKLCLFALKYVRDNQTAEEIVSRVFKNLWEKRKTISINQNLSSYLFKAVYNESMNYLNSFSRRQQPTDSIYQHIENHIEAESGFLSKLYAEDLEKKIKKGIHELPEKCRDIFYMSRYESLSHKEIAERLNISVKTVENQIGIALEKLRETLQSEE
jgi:RNA polymerase sigma-70 factor (ECF subfamily)